MEKTCCICKLSLPVEKFKSNKTKKDGLQSQCIECHKEYRRQHYLKNKEKYIEKAGCWRIDFRNWWKDYKKQFSCQECGESHPACIQFHHNNDDKENNVSYFATNGSMKGLMKEIKKCIPLCANCHSKIHWKEESGQN